MLTIHGYSFRILRADYFKSFVGIIICITPYILSERIVGAVSIFLGFSAIFAVYGMRTIGRQMVRIAADETEITMKVFKKKVMPWDRLSDFSLSYFQEWRSGNKGWMQLRLQGAGQTMRIESTLSDFEALVRRAVVAASVNKLEMTNTTLRNIEALNIDISNVRPAV